MYSCISSVGSHPLIGSDGTFRQEKARHRASLASQTLMEVTEHGHGSHLNSATLSQDLPAPSTAVLGGDPTEVCDNQQKAISCSDR